MVFLCVYCALLATGMAQPTDAHEHAMRAVLRWLRGLKSMQQCFPSPESKPFNTYSQKLIMYYDASWAPLRMLRRRWMRDFLSRIGGKRILSNPTDRGYQ